MPVNEFFTIDSTEDIQHILRDSKSMSCRECSTGWPLVLEVMIHQSKKAPTFTTIRFERFLFDHSSGR